MADRTKRFGFTTLNSETDRLDLYDWKFGVSDRHLLDRLLLYGEHHAHTGVERTTTKPLAPVLDTLTVGGRLPAGTTIYYKIGVVDENGQEQIASEMAVAHTADQVEVPRRPRLTPVLGGMGGLVPGQYAYAISAFAGSVDLETQASQQMVTVLRQTGSIQISLPDVPAGAGGLNIYRKGPTDRDMVLLATVEVGSSSTYEDAGVQPANRRHLLPTANTTHMVNSVVVTPGEAVPSTSTWKLYRTFVPNQWDNSLVVWNHSSIEEYVDTGHQTQRGAPSLTSAATGTAPKIDMADMAEVTGELPPGRVLSQVQLSFTYEGALTPGYPEWYWVCEYDQARALSMRATLGKDSSPAAQSVRAGFQKWDPDEEDWFDCFNGYYAEVEVGESIGDLTAIPSDDSEIFERGDRLRMVVLQTGGGATPTDEDLVVSLDIMVKHGDEDVTYIWES